MKAAIVTRFDLPPSVSHFDLPQPTTGEVIVRVEATALTRLARAMGTGEHYTKLSPPFVPGVDGVGQMMDGTRVYFAFPRAPWGSMAEYTTVNMQHVVPVPDPLDSLTVAALANPAMSSWAALNYRAQFKRGDSVLINGASGTSGKLAVQICRLMGASRIVVTARDESARQALHELGADEFISLNRSSAEVSEQVVGELERGLDVVLDYLWGEPAHCILDAIHHVGRANANRSIKFVNIGAMAGKSIPLDASLLRSSCVQLMGSGLGSLTPAELVDAVGSVMSLMKHRPLLIEMRERPLEDIGQCWDYDGKLRNVFTIK
jgi:NADPH:quinone reductase-like Zn-dependent oxidoreductase